MSGGSGLVEALATGSGEETAGASGGRATRLARALPVVVLALVCYVPLLVTRPGRVGADTKTYLYLDPGRLLSEAPYLWDPSIGLGTVTHQTIGYLFPMGPYYWLMERVGVPDWVAQRLWLASLLFLAGLGVRFLLRTFGWRSPVALGVAMLAYALSPYALHYAARISVILLPWVALPWLIALAARATRRQSWRDPAWFALVVLAVGGVNATSLVLMGLGPVLWLAWAGFSRTESWRAVGLATVRIGVLTLGTSLWWMAGLALQGRYGIPILRYTETYEVVAEAALAPELLRGLGYWFFYGNDKLGPWIAPSVTYTTNLALLTLSYALPLAALALALCLRWRQRAFFVALAVVGLVAAVGAHPFDSPSPLGALFKAFTATDTGLAFRSTPRAVPLVVLATAVFLGAGVGVLARRVPWAGVGAGALVALLVAANLPALWTGDMVDRNLDRPQELPAYWPEAAAYLDTRGDGTRALELPGADFAAYRWGNTVDPVTPGLMDRPYVARELIPWGSPPAADLLNAFDRRLQEGVLDPEAIAPIARLLGVGDIVLRSDLQFERYRTPRPDATWAYLRGVPGLDAPVGFGEAVPNTPVPELPLVDEIDLATPAGLEHPPPVAAFGVRDPVPIVRARPSQGAVVVAGDGEGLVEAAAAGVVDPTRAVFYAATVATRPDLLDGLLAGGAELVVTDANRKRARRWGTIRENTGYTERAGEQPLVDDPSDNRLAVFPGAGDDSYTVSEQTGGATASATAYGNPVTYTPSDRAAHAVDGDEATAWKVGAFDAIEGERLVVELEQPVTTDHLELLQAFGPTQNRWITEVALRFDGGEPVTVTLDDSSRRPPGQRITFEPRTFRTVEVEILAADIPPRPRYDGISGVGFAEVRVGGTTLAVEEWIRVPVDLTGATAGMSRDHRLSYVFARLRTNPSDPVRTDEELALLRLFTVPDPRGFSLSGRGRLSAAVPDERIDELVGVPGAAAGGVTARSSARLPGFLGARAASAFDGDPATAWITPVLVTVGAWVEAETAVPVTVDRLDLVVRADGRYSVPTRVGLDVDGRRVADLAVPPVADAPGRDATASVPLTLPRPVTGRVFRLVVDEVRPVTSIDWYGGQPVTQPVGIAEVGLAGVQMPAPPAELPVVCRDDLVSLDGAPVPVTLSGSTAAALRRDAVPLVPCAPRPGEPAPGDALALAAGEHRLRSGEGRVTGVDVDQLVLGSAAGGAPVAGAPAPPAPPQPPAVEVLDSWPTGLDVRLDGAVSPTWLVLGQSYNRGWNASVERGPGLGPPTLIDGFANGWLVLPPPTGGSQVIRLRWSPQAVVWVGLGLSALAVVACVALVVFDRRRRRPGETPEPDAADLPSFADPRRNPGRPPGTPALVVSTVATLVVAGLAVTPLVGVLAAAGLVAAALTRPGRIAVRVVAMVLVGGAAAYVIVQQARRGFPPDFIWPVNFERAHVPTLAGVAFVAVDAAAGLLRGEALAPTTPGDPPGAPTAPGSGPGAESERRPAAEPEAAAP